jgi:hypothetical protein
MISQISVAIVEFVYLPAILLAFTAARDGTRPVAPWKLDSSREILVKVKLCDWG